MCLILSLGCCGCSSPKPCHKNSKKQQQKQQQQEQHLQHQPKNYHSDIQLNELSPELSSINCQVTTSQPSLSPSLSPSLTALPHRIATSSTLSSWAGEEELCDMEDYDSRMPTRWTAWWLKGAAVEGDRKACHSTSIVS
ncbi:uncharacterized protein [Drosophila takahashii]|uniref:uncharacterized protein isoform X2 n=1 Tax=Drosophila takahashii TaxID=29030 RepID=UPI001CF9029A|nr:uncharacterized protein LOC108063832 [Drosophila takahashii]